jgi:hypothetical protein
LHFPDGRRFNTTNEKAGRSPTTAFKNRISGCFPAAGTIRA